MKLYLLMSILLHLALIYLVRPSTSVQEPVVSIKIEYRKGQERSKNSATETSKKNTKAEDSVSVSSQESTSQQEGNSVLGESIGVRAVYPRISRELGEEGTVLVEIHLSAKGEYEFRLVPPSSGHERLDQAALSAVAASLENGVLKNFLENKKAAILTFIFRLR